MLTTNGIFAVSHFRSRNIEADEHRAFLYWCFLHIWAADAAGPAIAADRAGNQTMDEFGRYYGFPSRERTDLGWTFKSRYTDVRFAQDSRKVYFNDRLVWLNGGILNVGGEWVINATDRTRVMDPLLRSKMYLKGHPVNVVVLDPGHGGEDSGATGARHVEEKRVVLEITRRVAERLRRAGVEVRLTRTGDYALSLEGRARRAEAWDADLFVSIHVNAASNRGASGHETYVLTAPGFASTGSSRPDATVYRGNHHDQLSMVLGELIQRGLVSYAKGEDRGVKHARYMVLKEAPCPAALVECGFVSNRREESLLMQESYRKKLSNGIASGILSYISRAREANQPSAR